MDEPLSVGELMTFLRIGRNAALELCEDIGYKTPGGGAWRVPSNYAQMVLNGVPVSQIVAFREATVAKLKGENP